MALKYYHVVWLKEHPHRSARWLQDKLLDGFDIHHCDGDHSNNDPKNLVLIEHTDHMMLHNGKLRHIGRLGFTPKPKKPKEEVQVDWSPPSNVDWYKKPLRRAVLTPEELQVIPKEVSLPHRNGAVYLTDEEILNHLRYCYS